MFFLRGYQGEDHTLKYLAGIFLTGIAILIGQIPLLIALFMKGGIGDGTIEAIYDVGLDNNLMLALIVMPFALGLVGVLLVVRYIHNRPVMSVLTSRNRLDWHRIFLAFGLWMGANAVFELVNYILSPEAYVFRPPGWNFAILVVVCLTLLPLQVAFEEVMFRGYLLQGLGRIAKNRWLPVVITSVIFGLMHLSNPEVGEYGTSRMMMYYIVIGLILAIITVMDDGLELPLGIHAATNIYSAVIVSYEGGAIRTNALFHSNADIVDSSILFFILFSVVFVFILNRIYGWTNWKKLIEPFELPDRDVSLTIEPENIEDQSI